jgi:hypothetical protein
LPPLKGRRVGEGRTLDMEMKPSVADGSTCAGMTIDIVTAMRRREVTANRERRAA